jgi:hypothetical protein
LGAVLILELSQFAGTVRFRLRSSSSGRTGAHVVTSKAEEYRAKAQECEELAEQTRDSFIKEQFLEVAKKWRHMAAYEEKHSR